MNEDVVTAVPSLVVIAQAEPAVGPLPLIDMNLYFENPEKWAYEQRRAFAHWFWEQDGCPDGKELEHWAKAEEAFKVILGTEAQVNWPGIISMVEKVVDDIDELRRSQRDNGEDKSLRSLLVVLGVLKARFNNMGTAVGNVMETLRQQQFKVA